MTPLIDKKGCQRSIVYCYLITEGVLYITFLWIDLQQFLFARFGLPSWKKILPWNGRENAWSNGIKFSGIVLCSIFTLWIAWSSIHTVQTGKQQRSILKQKDRTRMTAIRSDSIVLAVALIFTVGADICLLLNDFYAEGVGIFLIVQTLYLWRIQKSKYLEKSNQRELPNNSIKIQILKRGLLRAVIGAILLTGLMNLGMSLQPEILLAVIYFVSFTDNLFLLLFWKKSLSQGIFQYTFFLWGMVFFYLCDISVGIFNLTSYLESVPKAFDWIIKLSRITMWLFYLPGQVLLSVSSGLLHSAIFTKNQE